MFFSGYEICEIVFTQVDIFRRELTYGKTYTAYKLRDNYYLMNDLDYYAGYDFGFFVSLDEWREKQIEKIII